MSTVTTDLKPGELSAEQQKAAIDYARGIIEGGWAQVYGITIDYWFACLEDREAADGPNEGKVVPHLSVTGFGIGPTGATWRNSVLWECPADILAAASSVRPTQ